MKSLEIHVLSTHHDLSLAELSGLPVVTETDSCESCGEVAGPRGAHFFPCSLILNADDEHWVVCLLCADPILKLSI